MCNFFRRRRRRNTLSVLWLCYYLPRSGWQEPRIHTKLHIGLANYSAQYLRVMTHTVTSSLFGQQADQAQLRVPLSLANVKHWMEATSFRNLLASLKVLTPLTGRLRTVRRPTLAFYLLSDCEQNLCSRRTIVAHLFKRVKRKADRYMATHDKRGHDFETLVSTPKIGYYQSG
jgi:hypothetical protein